MRDVGEALAQVFSKVGDVKRIVMGLDKHTMTPCGFCFVVYYTREDAEDCVKVPSSNNIIVIIIRDVHACYHSK